MALSNPFFSNLAGGATSPLQLSAPAISTAGGVFMARLGEYMFALDTAAFQQLERQTEYRWQLQNRIGRAPAAQFTGRGEDSITLQGVIYPHFRGGIGQVGQMRASAARGEPLPLIYGFESIGQYCGRWAIKSIREGRTEFMRNGAPRKIEFSISLTAYGEDGTGAAGLLTIPAGFSIAPAQSPSLLGTSSAVLDTVSKAVSSLPTINSASSLADIKLAAGTAGDLARSVSGIASSVRNVCSNALGTITAGAASIMTPETLAACKDTIKTAQAVMAAKREIETSLALLGNTPDGIKRSLKAFGASMASAGRSGAVSSGVLASAAGSLESQKPAAGVDSKDRLLAAASASSMAREANKLVFAAGEAVRLAGEIGAKING